MKMMKEPDGIRGLVPAREDGSQDRAFNAYLKELNPRENEVLQAALECSEDNRFIEFLDRVLTPRYTRASLATIAKGCGISLKDFNTFWQKANVQAAIAIAQMRTPKITRDMADDAESKVVTCPRCDGLKWIAAAAGMPMTTPGYKMLQGGDKENQKWIRDCPDCQDGKVKRPGDAHARDKILEISGLVQKGKGGPSVNINFGSAHASAVTEMNDSMTIDLE